MVRPLFHSRKPKRPVARLQCVHLFRVLSRYKSHILKVLGKAEGAQTEWHGHITAVSVAPEYRRLSLARNMCQRLEFASDGIYKGYFVDLYVRCNNALAIKMYEGMGYSVYRRVREYYGNLGVGKDGRDEEDAFGAYACNGTLDHTDI